MIAKRKPKPKPKAVGAIKPYKAPGKQPPIKKGDNKPATYAEFQKQANNRSKSYAGFQDKVYAEYGAKKKKPAVRRIP
jgi:hypothetical protein